MKLLKLLAVLPMAVLLMPHVALAGAPELQVTPLQYEDTLSGTVKNGHIDVANPSDAPVTVEASVRRFTQTDDDGDLAFNDDADLSAAIKLDLTSFQLEPHDAIRVLFSVDPSKLPAGGTYAAIFFRTIPSDNSGSSSSYVSQSANIGTLLILNNGTTGTPSGGVSSLSLPFWQFGAGLRGSTLVANTASPHGGIAFRPELTARVLPWGHAAVQPTGLILPGANRRFSVSRPGSFFGLLPVTITDATTHTSRTVWVFACTGWSGWVLLVLLLTALVLMVMKPSKRPMRLRMPKRVPVLEPLADAIAEVGEPRPVPTPESVPEAPAPTEPAQPLPAPNPKVTKLIVQAEAAAPDPGTVIQPQPSAKQSAHKVSVKAEPDPQTMPMPKPKSKPKTAHKIKVKSHDQPVPRKPRSK